VKRYTVILTREDDAYLVNVPALPNIHTYGHTVEEALSNAQEAIELYLSVLRDEGLAMPDDVTTATVEVAA
jgi:predicted RNase H-like HicB family nuclease